MRRFSYEKHLKSLKTADSTHICLLDLVLVLFIVLFTFQVKTATLFTKSVALFMKSAAFRKTTCKEL